MFRFVKLREEHLPMVLEWRVKPRVSRFMFTDVTNDPATHKRWFAGLQYPHWVIYTERPIGVISLGAESWGYYIGEDDMVALGGLVPPYLYNHAFKTRRILRASVMAGNSGVLKLHAMHGYRMVGTRINATYKSGTDHDVHDLELSRDDWLSQAKKYGHFLADFEE